MIERVAVGRFRDGFRIVLIEARALHRMLCRERITCEHGSAKGAHYLERGLSGITSHVLRKKVGQFLNRFGSTVTTLGDDQLHPVILVILHG